MYVNFIYMFYEFYEETILKANAKIIHNLKNVIMNYYSSVSHTNKVLIKTHYHNIFLFLDFE